MKTVAVEGVLRGSARPLHPVRRGVFEVERVCVYEGRGSKMERVRLQIRKSQAPPHPLCVLVPWTPWSGT